MADDATPTDDPEPVAYDFRAPDGTSVDPAIAQRWRALFHESKLTVDEGKQLVAWFQRMEQEAVQAETDAEQARQEATEHAQRRQDHERQQAQVRRELEADLEARHLQERTQVLVQKQYSAAGLTPQEAEELRLAYQRRVA